MTRSFAALLLGGLLVLGAVRDTQAAQFLIDTIGDSITVGYPYYSAIEGNGCTPPCGGYQPKLGRFLRRFRPDRRKGKKQRNSAEKSSNPTNQWVSSLF